MNRLRFFLVAAFAVLAALAPALAQEPPVTRERSPGGLPFRHVLMPGDTHQALFFGWPGGLATGESGREAEAAFTVRMILEGPKNLSRSQLIESLRDLQANINLLATFEHVRGNLVAPARRFPDAAVLLGRMLSEPAMAPDTLKAIAVSRLADMRQARERAEVLAQRLFAHAILGPGVWRNIAAPEPAMVEAVTLADVEAWRRDHLARDTLEIVVAGPMPAEAAGRLVDAVFAGLPPTARPRGRSEATVRHPGKTIVLERPVVQTIVVAGGPAPVADAESLLRAELAAAIVSGGRGRLFSVLRETLGATYGVAGRLQPVGGWRRAYIVTTAVANDRAAAVLEAVRSEYARVVSGGVPADEVEPLKTQVATRHVERIRRAGGRASATLDAVLAGLPDDYPVRLAERLAAIDAVQVSDTLRAVFPKAPLTIVVIAPSAEGLGADCVIKAAEELARCE